MSTQRTRSDCSYGAMTSRSTPLFHTKAGNCVVPPLRAAENAQWSRFLNTFFDSLILRDVLNRLFDDPDRFQAVDSSIRQTTLGGRANIVTSGATRCCCCMHGVGATDPLLFARSACNILLLITAGSKCCLRYTLLSQSVFQDSEFAEFKLGQADYDFDFFFFIGDLMVEKESNTKYSLFIP